MANRQLIPFPGVSVYDDNTVKPKLYEDYRTSPAAPLLTEDDYRLSELLRQAGRDDAAELARPVKLLGNFKPAKMIVDIQALAERCGGNACIVLIRKTDMLPEMIWSFDSGNGVNRLVNCRMNGGWIIGTLEFSANGTVTWHAEDGDEKELYELLLSTFARGYTDNKRWEPAEALLALANKDVSDETAMNEFSLWSDAHPIDIHDEITYSNSVCTENVQQRKAV